MISYWSYWVHRVQELWRNYEELLKRVSALENKVESLEKDKLKREGKPALPEITKDAVIVVKALESLGRAATVEEINSRLKEAGITESLKETLLKRLKKPVQDGIIGYDPETKRFSL